MKSRITYHRDGSKTFEIDGQVVTEKVYNRRMRKRIGGSGVANVNKAYSRPLKSLSMGCHPSQVAEFNAQLEREGIRGARHLPDGTMQFETRKARRLAMKAEGMRDGDGCYGDG